MNSAFKSWTIALVGGLFFFYNFMQLTLLNPLAPAIIDFFHMDPVDFGSINSGFLLAVALVALPGGILADKIRTKKLLLVLTLITVINLFITSQISDPAVFAMLRFIQGMTHAFAFTLCMKLAIQWIAPKRLATASSLIVTIGLLGGALSQPLMTYFLTTQGLHQAWLNDAYIGIGIFVLFALVVRDNDNFWQQYVPPTLSVYFRGLRQSLFNPQNWMGGLYVCLLNLPIILLGASWGQMYMEHTWSLMAEQGSFIITLIFMGAIVGCPFMGFVSDLVRSRKLPMIVGSVLSTVVMAAILLFPSLSHVMLGAFFFLLGITTASQVLVYPMIAESNSPSHVGASLSIVTLVLMAGNAVANMVFSALINSRVIETAAGPQYSAETFKPGMWMIWASLFASLLVIGLMRETFKKMETA